MKIKEIMKIGAAGFISSVVMVLFSFLINEILYIRDHQAFGAFRPDSDPLVFPGLLITSLIWGLLVAAGYRLTRNLIPLESRFLRGMAYGGAVFALFFLPQELFHFQFVAYKPGILISGLLHYQFSLMAAGIITALMTDTAQAPAVPRKTAGARRCRA